MRSLLFIITSIFIFTSSVVAQTAPAIDWSKAYGGSSDEGANCIRQTKDGGYIFTGLTMSTDGDLTDRTRDDSDLWVVKLNSTGQIEWQKSLGGTADEAGLWVEQTSDEGYVIAGTTQSIDGDVSDNHGYYDYWILKLSKLGTIEWKKTYGGGDDDEPAMIRQTSDGGYIVAGTAFSDDGDVTDHKGLYDYWILKLSSSGTIDWAKSYGGTNEEAPLSIRQASDNGYVIAGYSYSNDGDVTGHHGTMATSDGWIIKLTENGSLQWQKSLGGSLDETFYDFELTADGGCILAGSALSNDGDVSGHHGGANIQDIWIVKINTLGNIDWQKSYGGTGDDEAYSISKCSDGGFLVGGYTFSDNLDVSFSHGLTDYWVFKIDATGTLLWEETLGGSDEDALYSAEQTTDNGYIAAGASASSDDDVIGNHAGSFDAWIVKLTSAPSTVSSLIAKSSSVSAYPNPMFSHSTIILPQDFISSHSISFSLVNTLGAEVRKEILQQGDNYIMLERAGLAAGLYHYWFSREDGVSMNGNLIME